MMVMRILLVLFLAFGTVAEAANTLVRDRIVAELQDDGYADIRISSTLLGRMRFIANKPGARREIVVNPRTGEVLRDYIRYLSVGSSSSGSSGSSGSGHNDDHKEDDDDHGGNSGSGSSNSGSGSSNSGSGSSNSGSGSSNSGSGSSGSGSSGSGGG
jgi:hypothetical protein